MNLKLVFLCMFWFGNDYLVTPYGLSDLTDPNANDPPFYLEVETDKFVCAGILIAYSFLVTPAYCVNGSSMARINLEGLEYESMPWHQSFYSTEIFIHDDFEKIDNYHINDIALVKIPEEVRLNYHVQPGKLITREQVQLLEGKSVNISEIFEGKHSQCAAQLVDQDRCSLILKNRFFRSQHFCLKWFTKTNYGDLGGLGNVVTMDGKIIGFIIANPGAGEDLISLILNFSPFLKWMSDTMKIPIEQFTTQENTENESLTKLQKKLNLRLDQIEKLFREEETLMDGYIIIVEEKLHSLTDEIKTFKAKVNNITDFIYNVGSLFPNIKVNNTL